MGHNKYFLISLLHLMACSFTPLIGLWFPLVMVGCSGFWFLVWAKEEEKYQKSIDKPVDKEYY